VPLLQAREAELAAQLRGLEKEARRAAQQAAATPPSARAAPAAPLPDEDGGDEEFEDAENLPAVNKMTISQV
jgi:hypothetical protein